MALQEFLDVPYNSPDIPWRTIMTWFAVGQWVFDSTLMLRQYRVMQRPAPPAALRKEISEQDFHTAQKYNRAVARSNLFYHLQELACTAVFVHSNFLANLWAFAGAIQAERFPHSRGDVTQSVLFYVAIVILIRVLQLPQQIYTDLVLEPRFNPGKYRQSALDFAVNAIFVMLINAICVTPVIIIALNVTRMNGDHFVLYTWLFVATAKLCWVIFENATPPSFFAKRAPLEAGELRTAIEDLTKREDFPFREIYVMDGRNSTIPAWIYGTPWSRNFVLRDTLLRQVNSQEITALTVHELGHWKLGHKYMTLAMSQLFLFIRVYIFCNVFINNPSFYAAFGFPASRPKVAGYVLYVLILGPIKTVFGLLDKIWSRRMEMQADEFAKGKGYGTDLASCLLNLTKTNLSLIDVDWMFAICKLNQPHLMERVRALGWKRPDEEGEKSR